jgi:hypothetical protein
MFVKREHDKTMQDRIRGKLNQILQAAASLDFGDTLGEGEVKKARIIRIIGEIDEILDEPTGIPVSSPVSGEGWPPNA